MNFTRNVQKRRIYTSDSNNNDRVYSHSVFLSFYPYTQVVPVFIALSFIGWIVFVAGFGEQNNEYVL